MRRLRAAIEGLDLGLLVNNAGVSKPSGAYLHEVDVEAWVKMVRVNLWALTEVTAAVLPGMVQRRRGAIVNMGSASSEAIPSFPLSNIYAATKRYSYIIVSVPRKYRAIYFTIPVYRREIRMGLVIISLSPARSVHTYAGTLPSSPGAFTSSIETKALMCSARYYYNQGNYYFTACNSYAFFSIQISWHLSCRL